MQDMALSREELQMARNFLDTALKMGADKCRVTLSKSVMDLIGTLDGEIDKVSHNMDRSVSLALFKDGKYGNFSTNRLDANVEDFVRRALESLSLLAEDRARDLPPVERTERSGEDAGLFNKASYESVTMDARLEKARLACCFGSHPDIISEEGEYSDSLTDIYLIDSDGACCRHRETAFEYATEVTIKDGSDKLSAYWWDSAADFDSLDCVAVGKTALSNALAKRHPQGFKGGKMTIIADKECSSRLLAPILSAMNGFALQQNNSFLNGKLGEKLFPEFLNITDFPREKGATGARLFDSEGVATRTLPLIERGVLKTYFINTYISNKTGMEPTVDDATRPCVQSTHNLGCDGLVKACREGLGGGEKGLLLITGFNGGNSNSATGDFSFGVEGFYEGPEGSFPVRECVITGNMLTLWNSLVAVGNDARACRARVVPSLVFEKVDVSS